MNDKPPEQVPLVSAIIPSYNYARFVCRAVDSVLSQTYSNIECIVVNDGSTDETLEVLKAYGDRIRVLTQTNAGLSAARNTGIRESRGACIALLDADDWWEPEKVTQQMKVLEEQPDVSAVGVGVRQVDGDLNPIEFEIRPQPSGRWHDDLRAVALRRLWVGGSGSGLLARRMVFDSVGVFDTELRAAEDWDMWLRLVSRFRLVNLPDILVNIHRHGSGVFRNAVRMEENQMRVFNKAVARWPEVFDAATRREVRALILADAGGELIAAGEHGLAFKKYRSALYEWPRHRGRWMIVARLLVRSLLKSPTPGQAH